MHFIKFIHYYLTGLFKEMGTTQEIPTSSSDQIVPATVVNQTIMRSEAQRLSTFTFWPHNDKVEARKIAKAGFFHTGIGMIAHYYLIIIWKVHDL